MSSPTQIHVFVADWETHKETLQAIRKEVFIVEQNVPQEEEWDGLDEDSTHFLAVTEAGLYIGCARLLPSGQIGRMAVVQSHRGTGSGAALLDAAVAEAAQQGYDKTFLNAQTYALGFYRKAGFVPYGAEFMEAGIPHQAMELKLPLAFTSSETQTTVTKRPQPVPAERERPSEPEHFDTLAQAIESLTDRCNDARRQVWLMHPTLDQELFEHPPLVEAISKLVRSAAHAEVRLLVMDTRLIVDRGHSLLELARRLDGRISIRVFDEQPTEQTSAMACIDSSGYWLLPNWQTPAGVADVSNTVTCRKLKDAFRQSWDRSREAAEFRTLKL